jgi:hypothetical protein
MYAPINPAKNIVSAPSVINTASHALLPKGTGRIGGAGGPPPPKAGTLAAPRGSGSSSLCAIEVFAISQYATIKAITAAKYRIVSSARAQPRRRFLFRHGPGILLEKMVFI